MGGGSLHFHVFRTYETVNGDEGRAFGVSFSDSTGLSDHPSMNPWVLCVYGASVLR